MAAWRKPSKQRSLNSQPIFETGHEDDGENYGGKNLEKVLNSKNVSGAVVVARWYGGVMLGPVRFDHIRNCASDAIAQWAEESERAAKRAKTQADKERLTQVLPERDLSITVLRGLLAEKKGMAQTASQEAIQGSPARAMDYATMELPVLERLEQVRDKTIGWILEQIEKAEKAQEEASKAAEKAQQEVPEEEKPANEAQEISGDALDPQQYAKGSERGDVAVDPNAVAVLPDAAAA